MSLFEPRTETVHIYGGDYHSRLEALQQRIVEAAESVDNNGVARMGSKPEHVKLAEEYEALVAEAADHRIEVTVQQVPRRVAKALRKAHPPRQIGDDGVTEREARGDGVLGVNEETFAEALVCGGTVEVDGQPVEYRSVVEPEMAAEDFDALSEGAFGVLYRTALDLNYGFVTDPKEGLLASLLTQRSDETSS
jgi:hypothetical protein